MKLFDLNSPERNILTGRVLSYASAIPEFLWLAVPETEKFQPGFRDLLFPVCRSNSLSPSPSENHKMQALRETPAGDSPRQVCLLRFDIRVIMISTALHLVMHGNQLNIWHIAKYF